MSENSFIAKSYADFAESKEEDSGKFVLISQGKEIPTLHLVLSPLVLTPFHAHIVELYLKQEGLAQVEMLSGPKCKILSPGWKIHGGGHFSLNRVEHNLVLNGKSTVYGKYDQQLLKPYASQIAVQLGLKDFSTMLE